MIRSRPAESGGVAAAIAVLLGRLLVIEDPDVLVALAVLVGFVPAAITWLVEQLRHQEAERTPAILEGGRPKP